jgi:hypothetical protein
MADGGWGYGGPIETHSETGLAEVLLAFAAYGGQLWGARRWPDNPLTLTHIRWRGPAGQFLDATRHLGDEAYLGPGERTAWVEVALHYPAMAAPAASAINAPWVVLTVDRGQAQALAATTTQPRRAGMQSGWPSQPGSPQRVPGWGPISQINRQAQHTPPLDTAHSYNTPGPVSADPFNASAPGLHAMNGWPALGSVSGDLAVIPCVEIELPPALDMPLSQQYAREYAHDVAIHFARATRGIPQVRERRGWMRDDRLVLAARMVFGVGRPVTRADMDNAAQLLADALAQQTVPYLRLTFAEPAEWQSGAALPE